MKLIGQEDNRRDQQWSSKQRDQHHQVDLAGVTQVDGGGDKQSESAMEIWAAESASVHEFHENFHSVTFIVLVNSHQR